MPLLTKTRLTKTRKAFIHWLAYRLPPCEEITPLVSASMDRKLTPRQRMTMRLHLMICAGCRRYLQHLHFMHEAFHHHARHLGNGQQEGSPGLSPEAGERIRRALSGE